VLRANGKSFSAGADLNWMQRVAQYSQAENKADAENLAELMSSLYYFPHPTLAVVQGAAFGGGVGLVSCCDIAVASDKASFCLSEVKLGLVPAVISPYVIAAIGTRQAQRYFLSAERFDAQTAYHLGLVQQLCTPETLDNQATALN
jgi:methylglutaconyl-CoA hydratase